MKVSSHNAMSPFTKADRKRIVLGRNGIPVGPQRLIGLNQVVRTSCCVWKTRPLIRPCALARKRNHNIQITLQGD